MKLGRICFSGRALPLILGATLLCVPLVGCGGGQGPAGKTCRTYLSADPTTLDPALSNDAGSGELCALLYNGLVRFDHRTTILPDIAERWEISRDSRTYTFHLRPGVRFTNGREVTAGDFKYSFERVLDPVTRSSRGWVFEPIAGAREFSSGAADQVTGIRVLDERILEITLDEPFAPFLGFLAMPAALVVPREEIERRGGDFSEHPVGTGPWILEEWVHDDHLLLRANEDYYQTRPKLDWIHYRIIPETMTVTAEFEAGNLEWMSIPSAEFQRWTEDPEWKPYIRSQLKLQDTYIGINNQKPPFDDIRVRQALNYAVDVVTIMETIRPGRGVRANGAIPPGLPGSDAGRPPYPYDPRRARRLLTEAGYPEGFRMEIWKMQSPEVARILEAVQAYLADVGIRAEIVSRDWGMLKQAINQGEPDAYYMTWLADYPDGENFLYPTFHSSNWGGGGNRARYRNQRIDELIERARSTLDDEARTDLYRRIDDIVHQEAAWLYLWYPKIFVVHQPWVVNFRQHLMFNADKLLAVDIQSP
jgi:peptide/nickel transport system substrate-binding protein/oligopeptide transport system substrate-binding protein